MTEFQPQKFERTAGKGKSLGYKLAERGSGWPSRRAWRPHMFRQGGQTLSVGKKTETAAQAWPEMKTIKKKSNSEASRMVQREESGNDLQTQVSFVKNTLCGRLLPRQQQNGLCVCVCVPTLWRCPINTHMQRYMQNELIRANAGVSFSCFIGLCRTKAMC